MKYVGVACVVSAAVVLGVLSAILLEPFSGDQPSLRPSAAPFPMETARKLSVDELDEIMSHESGGLILPMWMPGNIELTAIYGHAGAMLVYSDSGTEDYQRADVTIQVQRSRSSPSPESIRDATPGTGKVVEVGDMLVVIFENASPDPLMMERGVEPIVSYFWHEGLYYIVTGIKGEVTAEDVIEIIRNMEPVGPKTMRISE